LGQHPHPLSIPGQYSHTAEFGLYFYRAASRRDNARWYDPTLGRFAQPDTLIPEQSQGTQAWDRYAYVNNNPLRYSDPSGHLVDDGCRGDKGGCSVTQYQKDLDAQNPMG
jgi:RHS repeat-associated protein